MAHSETWARRLVKKITTPRELLQRRCYRTPVFLRIYLDHVEEIRFRNPRAGLKLAEVAPQLALLVPAATGEDGRREHRENRENLVRAHWVLAGAYRVTGRDSEADSQYALASEAADSGTVSALIRADLTLRMAPSGSRGSQERQESCAKALALVDAAEAVYRAGEDRRRLAEAHAVRGYVLNEAERFVAAIPYHGKALKLALSLERTRPTDPADVAALARVVESARTNLALAITEAPGCGFAATALASINAAHNELRGRRDSLTRHLLQWTEGKVYMRLYRPDRAEKRFEVARRGFARLEAPWEIALVSLDLAVLYRAAGRWRKLQDLAVDTSRRFRDLCGDFEAIAALSLWSDAVEARRGIAAAIDGAREVVVARRVRP